MVAGSLQALWQWEMNEECQEKKGAWLQWKTHGNVPAGLVANMLNIFLQHLWRAVRTHMYTGDL